MTDAALAARVTRELSAAELDAAYAAYDALPLDQVGDWGDLASFRAAVGVR